MREYYGIFERDEKLNKFSGFVGDNTIVRLLVLVGLVSETNLIDASKLNLVVFLCVPETQRWWLRLFP